MLKLVIANGEGGVGMPTSADALLAGKSALDAIEAGIRVVEADPSVRSVGFGGAPNALGEMECDASVMCGATLRTGAVGAVKNCLHVFSVARQVMERLPHVMLVGEGAARFAAEIGETTPCPLSDPARSGYERWKQERVPAELQARWPDVPLARIVWPPGKGPATIQ